MMKKYVIIKGKPILFSTEIVHSDIIGKFIDIESAGFFLITDHEEGSGPNVICMGESTSLSVRSRPEIDQKLIADFLRSDML